MTFEPDWAIPPGDTIARLMSVRELAADELAIELGLHSEELEDLLSGRYRISEATAKRLSQCLGSTPDFWIRRDQSYVREAARVSSDRNDDGAAWLRTLPVAQMRNFGWISNTTRKEDLRSEVLAFFGSENLAQWKAVYTSGLDVVSFRTSSSFESNDHATLVWKRVGEIHGENQDLSSFDKSSLLETMKSLKRLGFVKSPSDLVERIRVRLNACGVAFTTARAPTGCRASGATWMLDRGNPIIHLSFRHLSDDHFWFTLYHEACHVLLGHGEHVAYDPDRTSTRIDRDEKEANEMASELLVPSAIWDDLLRKKPNADNVMLAARSAKVAVGVIAGQLEKAGVVPHGKLSFLKKRFSWDADALVPVAR